MYCVVGKVFCVVPGIAGDIGVVKAGVGLLVAVVVPVFDMRSPSRHLIARFDTMVMSHIRVDRNLRFELRLHLGLACSRVATCVHTVLHDQQKL